MNSLKRHILVCPMNWGLGHATRCIPVIKALLDAGARVTLAASGRSLALLRKEFPELETFDFPGFSPKYPKNSMFALKMLLQVPSFIYHIIYENYQLSKAIKVRKIDMLISDNRYGLTNKKIKTVLLIHQLNFSTPQGLRFLRPFLNRINYYLIDRFDFCWIPDNNESPSLAGILSHPSKLPRNARFIGPLSRFNRKRDLTGDDLRLILVILSGQEPQRTILENEIIRQLRDYPSEIILIGGRTTDSDPEKQIGNIRCIPYADSTDIESLLRKARLVICRSGYSGIMDLCIIGGKALFIPTPGQTEQEYLAKYYHEKGIAYSVSQGNLNLETDIVKAMEFAGFAGSVATNTLRTEIDFLLGIR